FGHAVAEIKLGIGGARRRHERQNGYMGADREGEDGDRRRISSACGFVACCARKCCIPGCKDKPTGILRLTIAAPNSAAPKATNTSSTSPSRTSITAAPRPRAHKQTVFASASIALFWMSSTGWRNCSVYPRSAWLRAEFPALRPVEPPDPGTES